LTTGSPATTSTGLEYEKPSSIDRAIELLATGSPDVVPLAGGTDLLVQMQTGRRQPRWIIDLKGIPELSAIEETEAGFRIGAAVCSARINEHQGLSRVWPGVVEAAELIGSTQIQNRASLGGNVCNASPAADSVPALVAARARATIAGPNGRREVPVEEIATGPGTTSLSPGEIVVSFQLPSRSTDEASGDAYLRLIPRSEMDIAVAGAAVNLAFDDAGRCCECRVAIGAVAPRVLIVEQASEILLGTTLDDDTLAALAAAAGSASNPIDDMRGTASYRRQVVGVLAKRAAIIAAERAGIRR
jgi:CO/xanthine dehydrogenase FAD-binding subunit